MPWWKIFDLTRLNYLLMGVWVALGTTATGFNFPFAQRLERQTQLAFYRSRGSVPPPQDIVILAIDEDSLNQGQLAAQAPDRYPELAPLYRFPWQRQAYAEAISRLMAAGAKSVSFDLLLTNESSYGKQDDERLKQVLQRWGDRVVLATAHEFANSDRGLQHYLAKPHFRSSEFGVQSSELKNSELENSELKIKHLHPVPPSPRHPVKSPLLGLINFILDPDGRIYHLSNDYGDRILRPLNLEAIPSFAEATLDAAGANSPPQARNARNSNPQADIFYYGGTGTFARVPFWQIIDPQNWEVHRQRGTFKNKIVLIGATADSLQDLKRTPFSEQMPGVEVHANAIATLMEGRAIVPAIPNASLRAVVLFLSLGAIGVILASRIQKPLWYVPIAVALSLTWMGASYVSFTLAGLIIPTAIPAIVLIMCGLSGLAIGATREQFQRIRLYHTLERYVAEPIVNEILDRHADDFQSLVQGRKVKAAILFSDIRSFTTFSLTREPEQVVQQLNTYLEAMVEAILAEGGTLDKFIGDAVMAEFGSPISHGEKEDALRAVRAAIGMRKALVQLQQKWREQGQEVLFNGIGIHYGEVIAGDIGSSKRREFAVIGDTVNVASRVEGLTGKLSVDILISESLYQWVKEEVEVVDMGAHPLKGRGDNTIRLYSVVGFKGSDRQLYLQMRSALRRYLKFRASTERAST
ncbi:MAG: adenylate/guanylate cyclase domain-containing protein [Cyanobacteriota bacterium]|nr:adenylate/guanylate cyclase domain-containing protein [Cyanobacteriota bacterium]